MMKTWNVGLFVKNLADKGYCTAGVAASAISLGAASLGTPHMFPIDLRYFF